MYLGLLNLRAQFPGHTLDQREACELSSSSQAQTLCFVFFYRFNFFFFFFFLEQFLIHKDFCTSPVAKTPCSQCRGPGFDS